MNGRVLAVAWYRFRASLPRRRVGYLTVILLVGLVGGLAMGAMAGARRTQSSFATFLADTHATDLHASLYSPASLTNSYDPKVAGEIARLPHVKGVATSVVVLVAPLGRNGAPFYPPALNDNEVLTEGSVDGLYFDQDRVTVAQGRMADSRRADEFVTTVEAARLLGWHVGQVLPLGAIRFQDITTPGVDPTKVRPVVRRTMRLVGTVVFGNAVVRDDVDRFPTYALFTPAFVQELIRKGAAYFPTYGVTLDHGSRDVSQVEGEIIHALPAGTTYNFHVTSVSQAQVERAVKPESIALGVFGAIAALAALLIAGQAVGRQLRSTGADLEVLRALGAGPAMTTADGLIGMLGAVVLGSVVAVFVAVGLSVFTPFGPVRSVDPSPGPSFDWTVLGLGLLVLIAALGGLTVALAYRGAPHRTARAQRLRTTRVSGVARATTAAGLPASAIAGIRFALERGPGRGAVPVRSALLGSALAVAVVVATLTFGSGLSTLVSHPALYGWNWTYAIAELQGGNIPPQARELLDHDPDVAAWTGYDFANAQIDGLTVPIVLTASHAALNPPILLGRPLRGNHEVVLGESTLAQLHKHVGDIVTVTYGTPKDAPVYVPPTPSRIVGTATLPAIGSTGTLHTSMGTGALVSKDIEPPAFRKALSSPDANQNGPTMAVVRLRTGVSPATGRARLQRIADTATRVITGDPASGGGHYVVLSVQQPAEIVNYRSTGATPAVLALGLAAGATVALGLTLAASVRRRRRDLALLKTLGFTPWQVAATVAWQASVAALVGILLGIPLGIALGRWLWILFARQIFAVPKPTVPVVSIVLVAVAAVVLANIVAALPGRVAARTPTATVLRDE